MKTICLSLFYVLIFIAVVPSYAQDSLLTILKKEMNREFDELKKQSTPVYYLDYRVSDIENTIIKGSFGCLEQVNQNKQRILTTTIRVGSPDFDNYHPARGMGIVGPVKIELPTDNNEAAITTQMWKATGEAYEMAVQQLGRVKGGTAINVEEKDKSPDFSTEEPSKYQEPIRKIVIDADTWKRLSDNAVKFSTPFNTHESIINSSVTFSIRSMRKYFISTEGAEIAENLNYVQLQLACHTIAEDGMVLPLYRTYVAHNLEDLPDDDRIMDDVKNMVSKIMDLRKAPVVEAYVGPAILSGAATGVFFHEIFGHRVEASRLKTDDDAQTFKNRVNEQVLNPALSVIFDPTAYEYRGFNLNGFYRYDDEGVKGKKVAVVQNGILKNFLCSRTPISGFGKSNGHGRAMEGYAPVSRQSNLLLEAETILTEEQLRNLFIAELRKQNLEFGYFFKEVSGGFTNVRRTSPNAFNINPTEVYRIYSDGRSDELVRGVNLVGTPLAMFSEIEAVGGEYDIFNGYCGAESGQLPVSSVCPMMLVNKIELQKKAVPAGNKPPIGSPE